MATSLPATAIVAAVTHQSNGMATSLPAIAIVAAVTHQSALAKGLCSSPILNAGNHAKVQEPPSTRLLPITLHCSLPTSADAPPGLKSWQLKRSATFRNWSSALLWQRPPLCRLGEELSFFSELANAGHQCVIVSPLTLPFVVDFLNPLHNHSSNSGI